MTPTDTNLRYLLAIYHLAKTMPEVTPLAMSAALPAREGDARCAVLYGE
ncbi:hypothetical protein [Gemmiger sp.]|nr:hypothetical protein [Gemmiger sp.]MDY4447828.1 hypothetical protein [Gemmiger sp.]